MDLPAQHSSTKMAPIKEILALFHSHLGFYSFLSSFLFLDPSAMATRNHFLLDTQFQDLWTHLSRAGTLSWHKIFHASAREKAAWCSQPTDVPTLTSDCSQEVNMIEYIYGALGKKKPWHSKSNGKWNSVMYANVVFFFLVPLFLLSIES